MPYEMRFLEQERCAVVVPKGEVSFCELKEDRKEVARCLAERGWRRILFDVRDVLDTLTLIEAYGLTASLYSVFSSETQIALLISRATELDMSFIEKSAQTYKIWLRIFYAYDDALAWLIYEDRSECFGAE